MYSITVYYNNRALLVYLPEANSDERVIVLPTEQTGWLNNCILRFYAIEGSWRVICPEGMEWVSDNKRPFHRLISDGFNISATGNGQIIGLYCREVSRLNTKMRKYITDDCITIGSQQADIIIDDKFISEKHGKIIRTNSGFTYVDTSKNGTFINGVRVTNQKMELKVGDVLTFACGVKLSFYGETFAINSVPYIKLVDKHSVKGNVVYDEIEERQAVYKRIQRPPYFIRSIEPRKYQIEPAPEDDKDNKQSLLLTVGPSLTMSLPMLAGSFLAGASGYAKSGVIMMVTSSVLAVSWTLANHFYGKHQRQLLHSERVDDYLNRLGAFEEKVENEMGAIVEQMLLMHPSVEECYQYAIDGSNNLWRNVVSTNAFLNVRLGLGLMQLPCEIKHEEYLLNM